MYPKSGTLQYHCTGKQYSVAVIMGTQRLAQVGPPPQRISFPGHPSLPFTGISNFLHVFTPSMRRGASLGCGFALRCQQGGS